jgi:hypothetical protein
MLISVTFEGTKPLICNKFSDAAAIGASEGDRGSSAGQDRGTPQEICKTKLYIGSDGEPMIPSPNVLRCIVDGGSFFKIGKKQITTQRNSLIYACLEIEEIEIKLLHREPWKVDTRPVRITATGGRILAHRPMFDDWRLSFDMELDETIINARLMRDIVDASAKRVGLGDFRPATKGPYGQFVVVSWVEKPVVIPSQARAPKRRTEMQEV